MKLTKAQQNDIDLCRYFYPCEPTEQEVEEYLAISERGEGKEMGKFSKNPLVIGKTRRGLHMGMWEEGILAGLTPYFTLLGGEENKPIPRYIVDFMKKEMFRGRDAEVIEECYQQIKLDEKFQSPFGTGGEDKVKDFIRTQISLAEKRGYSRGVEEEGVNCYDHCEKARKEGQEKAVEFISKHEDTEWATDDICYVTKELLEQAKSLEV